MEREAKIGKNIHNLRLKQALAQEREKKKWQSLRRELEAIRRYPPNTPYRKAGRMLYEALLPLQENSDAEVDKAAIRTAGKILYEAEGMGGMRDPLLWGFIPKSCKSIVILLWHGIGEWRADGE